MQEILILVSWKISSKTCVVRPERQQSYQLTQVCNLVFTLKHEQEILSYAAVMEIFQFKNWVFPELFQKYFLMRWQVSPTHALKYLGWGITQERCQDNFKLNSTHYNVVKKVKAVTCTGSLFWNGKIIRCWIIHVYTKFAGKCVHFHNYFFSPVWSF